MQNTRSRTNPQSPRENALEDPFCFTKAQFHRERSYRLQERLGILCGASTPTPAQISQAELEVMLWESRLLLHRIVQGTEPQPR